MQVIVEAKTMKVTPAIQEHAEKHARKIFKLSAHIVRVRLFLETIKKKTNDPTANTVTYTVEMPGKDVVVRSRAPEMYEAITKASASASRRVRKELEKEREKGR